MKGLAASAGERSRVWFTILLIGASAVFLRIANLGTFSLWLDEVFTMNVASRPLVETLALCAADAENVPLYAVVTHFGIKIGLVEPWIRLLPIAAAVTSIWFLAIWTLRRFGQTTALIVAAFCALSPFHIRYSQELRAYPFLLLMCTATLLLIDRLRRRPNWRSTFALAAIVGLGCYTNLTYVLMLVPAAGMVMITPRAGSTTDSSDDGRNIRIRFAIGVALGGLSFVPWIWMIRPTLIDRVSRLRTTDWTLAAVGQRWEGLTVAPDHFQTLSWIGIVLAVIFSIGITTAARTRIGRWVLLPALLVLLLWEVLLVLVHHWSSPRYDSALWPFLAILLALGFERVLSGLRWRWLRFSVCSAITIMFVVRVDGYYRHGRQHWDLMAEAVHEIRRPSERVVTIDPLSRICLSHYLDGPTATIGEKPERLRSMLGDSRSLLVVSRQPLRPVFSNLANTRSRIAIIPRTGRLYRLRMTPPDPLAEIPDDEHARPAFWPKPVTDRVSEHIGREPAGLLGHRKDRPQKPQANSPRRIDFDQPFKPSRGSGWGRSIRRSDGTTWVWVLGHEASIDLGLTELAPHQVAIRVAALPGLAGSQWIRLVLNGHVLGEKRLRPGPRELRFNAPARFWRGGDSVLVLQFGRVRPGDGGGPPRSAAVDWIEITPRAGRARNSDRQSTWYQFQAQRATITTSRTR